MALEPLNYKKSANRQPSTVRNAPGFIDARVLGVATNETHTVPAGASFVYFSSTGPFYARPNAVAAVPAGDVTDGTGSEYNPVVWALDGVLTIGLISAAAQTVTLSFYK
jgi:hypothetical protein